MSKYLREMLNFIIGLGILFVGGLFVFNFLVMGFIFFPEVTARVNQLLISQPVWQAQFVLGTLPLCFLLSLLGLGVFSMFKLVKLAKEVDFVDTIQKVGLGIITKKERA